jgi:hypothetical protein
MKDLREENKIIFHPLLFSSFPPYLENLLLPLLLLRLFQTVPNPHKLTAGFSPEIAPGMVLRPPCGYSASGD